MSARIALVALLAGLFSVAAQRSMADGDAVRGAMEFRVCSACHSLRPDLNMTGPSLAGAWDRKAGSLASFDRYSAALKASGVVWNATTFDAWLKNPAQYIPGNFMMFAGILDARARADVIAFLRAVSERHDHTPAVNIPAAYLATPMNLKDLPPARHVTAIQSCRDSYFVTTADGRTRPFWDESLRFETDASRFGPRPGAPAMLPAGMFGDRAFVIFAKPDEISSFIKEAC